MKFFLDSELVVKQLQGKYKVKNEKMKLLFAAVKLEEKHIHSTTYIHVPRSHEFMQKADRLVNEALDDMPGKSLPI